MHRVTAFCVLRPWLTLLTALALLAGAGYSVQRTELSVGMDANLGAGHPAVTKCEDFLEAFGGGYPVLIAYECAGPESCRDALDPVALAMAHAVARRLAGHCCRHARRPAPDTRADRRRYERARFPALRSWQPARSIPTRASL